MIKDILSRAHQDDLFREKLRMDSPYYPEYIKRETPQVTYLSTIYRSQHDDHWYAIHFIESGVGDDEVTLLRRLTKKVYLFQVLGRISPEMKDVFGNNVFPLDKTQQPEIERLDHLLHGKKSKKD